MAKVFKSSLYKFIGLSFFLFTISSCTKTDVIEERSNSDEQGILSDRTNNRRGSTIPVVSLSVNVLEIDPSGNISNITGDGKGDYLNGVDYVQAVLDQYGTFAFNTFNSTSKSAVAKRWISYNFNNPVDPNNTYRPSPSNSKNYHFSTGSSSYGTQPFIPIQNLGINGNPASECIYMGNGLYNSTTTWTVSFHKGLENTASSPTGFAVITRTKIKAVDGVDEWTVTAGSCSGTPNTVASLRTSTSKSTILHGYYYLPYFFTLRAL